MSVDDTRSRLDALAEAERGVTPSDFLWPDPQPLTAAIEPEPYPLDALPDLMRAAVAEVAGFVQAPIEMVATSALSAVSIACQAHIDVKRAEKLTGPVSLFTLTVAESGERKTTCDGFFQRAIRDYQAAQEQAARPLLDHFKADSAAWEAKCSGIKKKIESLAKEQKSTQSMEAALRDLEQDRPSPLRIPRLVYADSTPEALAFNLAKRWPSGGVVSSEGGVVLGSHGMGNDSVMRNLAVLNVFWDGGEHAVDRRTTESFVVRNARLTMSLQIQEATLREFLRSVRGLARGTGFLSRFLIAWPRSTQGTRFYKEPPDFWPSLERFNANVARILDQPIPLDQNEILEPVCIGMERESKAAWIEYHNLVEQRLSAGGEYADVRDVAAKSADNAARIAALFQCCESGAARSISVENFVRASLIAAWHLHESRRFFGELALPPEMADATRLNDWLIRWCLENETESVSTRDAQQRGPVREKERLNASLDYLCELDRLGVDKEGRRKIVRLNPKLLDQQK